tara:strand:- start:425 stop:595 length:171 start_codon:yes stop_codon:yes gene_type:complete
MGDLVAERHHYGLRQIDVAERLGMTRERLAFLETAGKEVEPTEEWAALYMAALKEG